MQKSNRVISVLVLFSLCFPGTVRAATPAPGQHFNHIVTIIIENIDYKEAVADPYLKALAKRGAFLSHYHALFHPSYPNYLAMVAGNFSGRSGQSKNIKAPNVADLLGRQRVHGRITRKLSRQLLLGAESGRYVRKHVPFLSFRNIQNNPRVARAW